MMMVLLDIDHANRKGAQRSRRQLDGDSAFASECRKMRRGLGKHGGWGRNLFDIRVLENPDALPSHRTRKENISVGGEPHGVCSSKRPSL